MELNIRNLFPLSMFLCRCSWKLFRDSSVWLAEMSCELFTAQRGRGDLCRRQQTPFQLSTRKSY